MKKDDTGNQGLLNSIIKSFKGAGSCCPPGNSCSCSESEVEHKKRSSDDLGTAPIKRLDIEWRHFAVGNATCERCGKTGQALQAAVEELRQELTSSGITITFSEVLLDKARIAESNEIRMNGVLLEDLLAATVTSTECTSCGTLAGESACCRATEIGDDRYEDIPVWAIKKAAYMALGIEIRSGK